MARGGLRPGGGRPKGSKNKVSSGIREAAQAYTGDALRVLASIMQDEKAPPAARVSAARELLDRGHGKPPQSFAGEDGTPLLPTVVIHRVA